MNKKGLLILLVCIVALVSLSGNIFLVYKINENAQICQKLKVDEKILAFRNMFTEKVLLSDSEIDFDTRLVLETSVRNLNDPEIFSKWSAFTKSETKEEATFRAKKLLEMLIRRTSQ